VFGIYDLVFGSVGLSKSVGPAPFRLQKLGRENLSRAAGSAADLKAILIRDAGLMVELKRWMAKDATGTRPDCQ